MIVPCRCFYFPFFLILFSGTSIPLFPVVLSPLFLPSKFLSTNFFFSHFIELVTFIFIYLLHLLFSFHKSRSISKFHCCYFLSHYLNFHYSSAIYAFTISSFSFLFLFSFPLVSLPHRFPSIRQADVGRSIFYRVL